MADVRDITMAQLPAELRRLSREDNRRLLKALRRTAKVDALRWIQWSIDGGGWTAGEYRRPVDVGDYKKGWRARNVSDGAILYSDADPPVKAGVIEFGRRPAWIPIAPLAEWVRRKLGVTDAAEARRIAFAISRKASKVPRPALKVLGRARPKILEALSKNVAAALKEGR